MINNYILIFFLSFIDYKFQILCQEKSNNSSNDNNKIQLSTWIFIIFGTVSFILILSYFLRYYMDHNELHTPLLGGQYNEDGLPLTRQNVNDDDDDDDDDQNDTENKKIKKWKCEVCDFLNKGKQCILCGTEEGFNLGIKSPKRKISVSGRKPSFNRTRSFAIRRINLLNSRQRGARNRQKWVRKVGIDGKRFWARRSKYSDNGLLESQSSVAFVSQFASSPNNPDGKIQFTEYQNADASVASRGYEISNDDLEILEQVAAMSFKEKYQWFLQQTAALIKPWEDGHLKIRIKRDNILVESMEQLLGVQLEHIHMPLRIEFIGETGIDAGGLEREWFQLCGDTLFDETIGLFMCAHVDSLAYVINPNSAEASVDHLLYYRGVGRLIGRALLEGNFMKAHLALPVLKHLLGVPISFSDLEFVDQELYTSLKWIQENDGVDTLSLDFSVSNRKLSGEIETIDLKPNGRNIDVNDENKMEYIHLRLKYIMLDSFADQLQHLMSGIFEVIPQELILVFDYQELELVLCGVPNIDVDDWKKHTAASSDFSPDLLKWFWEIIDSWSTEEQARLLQFTTGSSRVPVQGFKALTSYDGRLCLFTLKAIEYPDNAYPRSHTCFNRIDLPKYPNKEELEEALSFVINMEVTGFTDQ